MTYCLFQTIFKIRVKDVKHLSCRLIRRKCQSNTCFQVRKTVYLLTVILLNILSYFSRCSSYSNSSYKNFLIFNCLHSLLLYFWCMPYQANVVATINSIIFSFFSLVFLCKDLTKDSESLHAHKLVRAFKHTSCFKPSSKLMII